jgi:hypothetical protein
VEDKLDDRLKIQIYNEIRAIVIIWFQKMAKHKEK